jgi:ELWxxDGT repeat protein
VPLPSNSITGQLTDAEPEKRYSIDVAAGDFQFNLTSLSADADIQLLSADASTVLRSSVNTGTAAERFIQPLDSGKYLLRIFRKAGNVTSTNFSLNLLDLADAVGNSEATAQNLGVIGAPAGTPGAVASPVSRVNYAVSGGKESPVDYYRFRLPSRGFVRVELTGKVSDGSALFGNLDVDLYEAGQSTQNVLSADSLGNAAEVFGGTLSGGTDYIVRVRPQANSPVGQGSTYNFRLSFSPRSDNPSIVRDIQVGTGSSDATNFTEVGGLAYFSAKVNDGGVTKNVLWQSEGTLNRTARIFEFEGTSVLSNFTNVNGQLYFVAQTAATGAELWTSDGTSNGTKLVSDLAPGTRSSNPSDLTVVGNDLFFYTSELDNSSNRIRKLYRITQGSTTPFQVTSTDLNATNPVFDELTNIDGTLYFSARDVSGDTDLWRAITSSSGVVLERMLLRPDGDDGSEPADFINVGGKLFLTADIEIPSGKERSRELIRIDTFNSGALFNPVNPGYTRYDLNGTAFDGLPLNSRPPMVYIEQTKTLYFVGNDPTDGTELHRLKFTTDPSENGVIPEVVQDVRAGGNSNPSNLLRLGNRVVFLADDGAGQALWITDENNASAVKLSSLTGLGSLSTLAGLKQLKVVNNSLFFVASDPTNGEELRKVTLSGNQGSLSTYNLAEGALSSSPTSLAAIGGQLFFLANNGTNGSEPWSLPA